MAQHQQTCFCNWYGVIPQPIPAVEMNWFSVGEEWSSVLGIAPRGLNFHFTVVCEEVAVCYGVFSQVLVQWSGGFCVCNAVRSVSSISSSVWAGGQPDFLVCMGGKISHRKNTFSRAANSFDIVLMPHVHFEKHWGKNTADKTEQGKVSAFKFCQFYQLFRTPPRPLVWSSQHFFVMQACCFFITKNWTFSLQLSSLTPNYDYSFSVTQCK